MKTNLLVIDVGSKVSAALLLVLDAVDELAPAQLRLQRHLVLAELLPVLLLATFLVYIALVLVLGFRFNLEIWSREIHLDI